MYYNYQVVSSKGVVSKINGTMNLFSVEFYRKRYIVSK